MISASVAASTHQVLMDNRISLKMPTSSSSRILDIPCKVCGDYSSGKHYNIFACDGCAGFFKRSIRRNRKYVCKAKAEGSCVVDKTHRNQCRACRLTKCQEAGMNKDAVQHERGPRNSTLRRQQMAHVYSETNSRMMPSPPATTTIPETGSRFSHHPGGLFYGFMPRPLGMPIHTPMFSLFNNPAAICESAASLLLMNVKWAKHVPSFTSLPMGDQLLLLEKSWRELFVLGAAQFLAPLDLGPVIQHCGALDSSNEKVSTFLVEVRDFQETLEKLVNFQVDPHEYACLRAIVLFKSTLDKPNQSPGATSTRTLSDSSAVSSLQDQTQLTLNKYILTAHPGQPLRFGRLLLLLPTLKTVSGDTIEQLFFRKTIGNIPIVNIICNMYKSTHSG